MRTYPVLQASLSILIESAVMTKASAQARCPRCGFGSEGQGKRKEEKKNALTIIFRSPRPLNNYSVVGNST